MHQRQPLIVLLALLCAGLAPSAWSAPALEAAETVATRFEELRGQLPRPPATAGFSAVSTASAFKAPPGDHGQTVAYKTKAGCVFFASSNATAAAWKGSGACNGKPLEGKGRLELKRTLDDKGRTVVHVMEGRFTGGMLTGPAIKHNFIHTAQGQLESTIRLKGEFANSVLHGDGERVDFNHAEDARPRAVAWRGNMVDGAPLGPGQFEREAPAPAVEADSYHVEFLVDDAISLSKPPEGLMILKNWDAPLGVRVHRWDGLLPETVQFEFMSDADEWSIWGHCNDLASNADGLACRKGKLVAMSKAFVASNVSDEWTIPVSREANRDLAGIFGSHTFFVGDAKIYLNIQCPPGQDTCRGMGGLPVAEGIYLWGDYDYKHGEGIVPRNGANLHEMRGAKANPDSDPLLASCEVFESATDCERGRMRIGDVWFKGAWTMAGSTHQFKGADDPYYQPLEMMGGTLAFQLQPRGEGRLSFPSGAWADVSFDEDGELDGVGSCGHPDGRASCELTNRRVMFSIERRQQASQPTRTVYVPPPSPPPPRFQPLTVPSRQTWIMPGSR